ncbi:MAG: thiamine-phosphate kinase [Gemmatimonadetes bacterium]|nr:thiamine-phosphate kinase [Gemmatimonadota bacterium]
MANIHLPLGPGSEFDTVRATLARWGSVARGTGDDGAVLDVGEGRQLVVSTDTTVENVHFKRGWFSSNEIAYRAAASAISDLAAMGAEPLGMLISMTLPDRWRAESMAFADGFGAAARASDITIMGGDLSSGSELNFCVTVLGAALPNRMLSRAGAIPTQALWVTGALGGPRLALQALQRGVVPIPLHRDRFVRPLPRLREARWLAAHGATSAIDISDGVIGDAAHIAAASRARLTIELEWLPVISGATMDDAAQSGEEYELLVSATDQLDAAAFAKEFGVPITRIGVVDVEDERGPGLDVLRGGRRVPTPRGHDHFLA